MVRAAPLSRTGCKKKDKGRGQNQSIYERHVTKSGRNRVKAPKLDFFSERFDQFFTQKNDFGSTHFDMNYKFRFFYSLWSLRLCPFKSFASDNSFPQISQINRLPKWILSRCKVKACLFLNRAPHVSHL